MVFQAVVRTREDDVTWILFIRTVYVDMHCAEKGNVVGKAHDTEMLPPGVLVNLTKRELRPDRAL